MRTHIAIGLCTSFMLLAACDFGTRLPTHPTETGPVAPTPPPPFVPSSTIDRDITVGEVVTDTVTESQPACARIDGWWIPCRQYRLTATATGTLVVRLTWDPFHNGVLLMLRLDSHDLTGSAPPWSPIIGRLPVTAGQSYVIGVELAGQDWFGGDSFVLETAME